MREALKKERTKQVQFRMPVELHLELRKALLNSGISMADLFNGTAEEYVRRNSETQKEDINRG